MKKSTLLLLFLMLICGTLAGVSKELPDDINKLTKMAQKGNVEAQLKLARLYSEGTDVPQNYEEAKYYYELAANKNEPLGLVGLGNCYLKGLGVSKNQEEAAALFKKAADLGDIQGKALLGYCYYFGYGVETDYDEAFKLSSEAAPYGYGEAKHILGRAYYFGDGVEENEEEAFKNLYAAYRENIVEAYPILAECLLEGTRPIKEYGLAFKLLSEAYQKGYAEAIESLSSCYINGWGTNKDPEKGFQLLLEAEKKGEDVNYSLGECYLEGTGVEKNLDKAVEYFKKANNPYGIELVADAYITEQNYKEAHKYYQMFADMADKDDSYDLCEIGNLYYNGYLGPVNYEEAVKYYRKSIEAGGDYAMENLAKCYVFGQGVPQSYEEAEKIYEELAAKGKDVKDKLYMCKLKGNFYKGLIKMYKQPMDAFATMILEDNNATINFMKDNLVLPYSIKKNGNVEVLDFKVRDGIPNHTLTSKDNELSWTGVFGANEGKFKMDFWFLKWPYLYFYCNMNPEYLKPIICDQDGYNVFIVFDEASTGSIGATAEAFFKEDGHFHINYDNPIMKNNLKSIQGTFSIENSKIILQADQGTTLSGEIFNNGDLINIDMGRISGFNSTLFIIR